VSNRKSSSELWLERRKFSLLPDELFAAITVESRSSSTEAWGRSYESGPNATTSIYVHRQRCKSYNATNSIPRF
jgi:hypothetical protein